MATLPNIIVSIKDLESVATFYKLNINVYTDVNVVTIDFTKKWYQKIFPFLINKRIKNFKNKVDELMMIGVSIVYC